MFHDSCPHISKAPPEDRPSKLCSAAIATADASPRRILPPAGGEPKLQSLQAEYPDEADFWNAFAGESDAITEGAPPADQAYAQGRIDCVLKNAGLIPGEDEGASCT
jgi:hypothetical protein